MLEVDIFKRRRDMTVEAAFAIEAGGAVGLFGPSGAGKSTVLSCIAGVEEPDRGYIRCGGLQLFPPSLPLYQRSVGYLTQEPNLFPHCNVAENVAFGLPRGRARDQEQRDWLERLRCRMHLEDCWQAPMTRISAGQARRVALARLLAHRPRLVLLDEAFAGLDRNLVRGLLDDLLAWRGDLGFTLIAVDHQSEVLSRLCPLVLAMRHGRILHQGSWDALRPAADADLRRLLDPL